MAFNPNDHLINLKGKSYLEVKFRLVWFREEHPDWGITTEIIKIDTEAKYAIVKATITDQHGRILAQGTKMEDIKGFGDWLEKAETGAIGRALGILGYGTQFAPEFDEVVPGVENPRIVDAPVATKLKVQVTATPTVSKRTMREGGALLKSEITRLWGEMDKEDNARIYQMLSGREDYEIDAVYAAAQTLTECKTFEEANELINGLVEGRIVKVVE
jgi:hypothetical protein